VKTASAIADDRRLRHLRAVERLQIFEEPYSRSPLGTVAMTFIDHAAPSARTVEHRADGGESTDAVPKRSVEVDKRSF
jgi:hypothetical protein